MKISNNYDKFFASFSVDATPDVEFDELDRVQWMQWVRGKLHIDHCSNCGCKDGLNAVGECRYCGMFRRSKELLK